MRQTVEAVSPWPRSAQWFAFKLYYASCVCTVHCAAETDTHHSSFSVE